MFFETESLNGMSREIGGFADDLSAALNVKTMITKIPFFSQSFPKLTYFS